ncbi:MAG: cellulase family glycosylhydrolase [Armatimonadia bacterium]|nr:cellulase family glycosylhydrolase [Armatimonadia bacterium]
MTSERRVRLHPQNRKILELDGRPLVLLACTEHYGAVMNRPFDYRTYLDDTAARGLTLTRLFTLFRELQSAQNPYSTCKPESVDYVSPYERTGPGAACDGLPKFDLDRPNPEFYARLAEFLTLAEERGIVVEVVLLSNTYAPDVWALNPLHPANNISGTEEILWPEYMSCRHPELHRRQLEHVRRIVEGTRDFPNIIYEICNEPGGSFPGMEGVPDPTEVDEWQRRIAEAIRECDHAGEERHLVAGQQAFLWGPFTQHSDGSFDEMPLDIVNVHPLPGTPLRGRTYDMGTFMSGELKVAELRDYCLAAWEEGRPLNMDEDNVASRFTDETGWTIHRKRAWVTLLCGAHYDMIDFSIHARLPRGTHESRAGLRAPMGFLAGAMRSMNLVASAPLPDLVASAPDETLAVAFGAGGSDSLIYLCDARESGDGGCGDTIEGSLVLDLPDGQHVARCMSPATGQYSPGITIGGGRVEVSLPRFRHDLALRIDGGQTG